MIARRHRTWLWALVWAAAATNLAHAQQAPAPLYEQDPYDQLTVSEAFGGGKFKVLPIAFPDRKVPVDPKPDLLLTVRMLDMPDTEVQIAWRNIAKVELFEDLVLATAKRLSAAQEFEAAFDHLTFLYANYPRVAGLEEAAREFRYRNAGSLFAEKRYVEALALLEEVYRSEPQRAGLAAALASVSQPLFDACLRDERWEAARQLAARTSQRGDEASQTLARSWQTQLEAAAREQERQARQHFAVENFRAAHEAARGMLAIWPELPGGETLAHEIAVRWPMVRVGVGQTRPTIASRFSLEWAARRRATLVDLPLAALSQFGPDGPLYTSPLGRVGVAENRRAITLDLANASGYDVAQQLLARADAAHASYDPLWGSLLKSANVVDVRRVQLDLLRPWPQPLAALASVSSGERYRTPLATPARAEFLAAEGVAGPREVIEIALDTSAAALSELRRGRLEVVERISAADAAALTDDKSLRVGRYAVPSIHLLVPNSRRTLPASSTFRRAIAFAIGRERILRDDVLGGVAVAGSRTLSGPFPAGDAQAAWSYGSDNAIAPLAYEPRLALTLLRVAEDEAARVAQASGNPASQRTPLVLGHGSDPLHRRACMAIAEDLTRISIACQCREIPAAEPAADQDCDFWYVELAITEPMVDALRLLGDSGLVAPSPYVTLAVREVTNASTLQQASDRLHALHAAIHAEQAVIPLWQTVNHFAYRAELAGVGNELVSLYGQLEHWEFSADESAVVEKP